MSLLVYGALIVTAVFNHIYIEFSTNLKL